MTVTRWANKRTSGRYVYRAKESGNWWWQCDLHPEDEYDDEYNNLVVSDSGKARNMQEAFSDALHHALVDCRYTNG